MKMEILLKYTIQKIRRDKLRYIPVVAGSLIFASYSFSFPSHGQPSPLVPVEPQVQGCIGDCASCHQITKDEAKKILSKKFDVKEILSIYINNGFFEIIYKNSRGKEEKINLFFNKNMATKEIIFLDE